MEDLNLGGCETLGSSKWLCWTSIRPWENQGHGLPKNSQTAMETAMGDPKWREDVYEEMKALKKNDTWVLSDLREENNEL